MKRSVIVNADDFGQSNGINRGIARAHESGILTSASLMVRGQAVEEAREYSRDHPKLSVGLHLDLGEWALRNGVWIPVYEVVDLSDKRAVQAEVDAQLEAFSRLMGRPPTHIDSHQHRHRIEPVRSIVQDVGARLGIPVRGRAVAYHGGFYGQDEMGISRPEWINVQALSRILTGLKAPVTEIGCHPAYAADLDTMYCAERLVELDVLCDHRVKTLIAQLGITLISYKELAYFIEL